MILFTGLYLWLRTLSTSKLCVSGEEAKTWGKMSVVLQAAAAPSESLLLEAYVMDDANNARFEENGLVSYSGVFLEDGGDGEEEEEEEEGAEDNNSSHDSHLTDDEEHSQHGVDFEKKGCKFSHVCQIIMLLCM